MKQSELKKQLINARNIRNNNLCLIIAEAGDNTSVKPMLLRMEGYLSAIDDILQLMNGNAVMFNIGITSND